MTERSGFVCVECGARVSDRAYRATCPECSGALRTAGWE